jgi:hypothetical protein
MLSLEREDSFGTGSGSKVPEIIVIREEASEHGRSTTSATRNRGCGNALVFSAVNPM